MKPSRRFFFLSSVTIAILAFLSYVPVVGSPFIEDDYPLIAQAVAYGSDTGWLAAFHNAVNRPRLTSLFALDAIHRMAGMNAAPYYLASIGLHVLNSLLVFALGAWRRIGYRVAALAAAFFAVYEGHNEAVMWISANNELLLFLFTVAAFVCWIHVLEGSRYRWAWYILAVIAFCLALLSKESAIIAVALFGIPLLKQRSSRSLLPILPFAVLAIVWIGTILATRTYSGHFRDGSFSLSSPFIATWISSYLRLFWIWGLLSLAALVVLRRGLPLAARSGMLWAAVALLPYVFLTYNTRVPSRHTYLASAGLAFVVAVAFTAVYEAVPNRAWISAIAVVLIVQNTITLWTRKREQFLDRAAPTEQLVALARRVQGPINVRCFPRAPVIAEQAVVLMTGRPATTLVWSEADAHLRNAAATFCYAQK